MEKTAMWQAIKKLEEEPLEMVSQKAIAGWLRACYVDIEHQQIINARISVTGLNHASPTDDTNLEDAEKYYNQKYTQ